MQATEAKQELSSRSLRDGNLDNPHGRHCVFYKLNDKWGAKVYCPWHMDTGEYAYHRQQEAETHGLAPATGPSFEIEENGETFFVYLTEIVEVAAGDEKFAYLNSYDDWMMYDHWHSELYELQEELSEVGVECDFDEICYAPNIGVRNGNQFVLIDFGP